MAQSDAHVIVNHRFICVYEFYTRLGDIEIFTILSCMDSALIVLTDTHTHRIYKNILQQFIHSRVDDLMDITACGVRTSSCCDVAGTRRLRIKTKNENHIMDKHDSTILFK